MSTTLQIIRKNIPSLILFFALGLLAAILAGSYWGSALYGKTNFGLRERFWLFCDLGSAFFYIQGGISTLQIVKRKGTIWTIWRYVSLTMLLLAVANLLTLLFAFSGFVTQYISLIFLPFYMLSAVLFFVGSKKFLSLFGVKSFFLTKRGFFVFLVCEVLLQFIIIQAFHINIHSVDGFPAVAIASITLCGFGVPAAYMVKNRNLIGGTLHHALRWFGIDMVIGTSVAFFAWLYSIIGFDSWISQNLSAYGIANILSGAVLVYSLFTVRAALQSDAEFEIAETLMPPYAAFAQAIIQKHAELIGPELAVAKASARGNMNVDASGKVNSLDVDQKDVEFLMSEYSELLGDASYDFVEDITKKFQTKYPQIVIPRKA